MLSEGLCFHCQGAVLHIVTKFTWQRIKSILRKNTVSVFTKTTHLKWSNKLWRFVDLSWKGAKSCAPKTKINKNKIQTQRSACNVFHQLLKLSQEPLRSAFKYCLETLSTASKLLRPLQYFQETSLITFMWPPIPLTFCFLPYEPAAHWWQGFLCIQLNKLDVKCLSCIACQCDPDQNWVFFVLFVCCFFLMGCLWMRPVHYTQKKINHDDRRIFKKNTWPVTRILPFSVNPSTIINLR